MKKIISVPLLVIVIMAGCKKYDDGYLNPSLPKTLAYFASFQEYSRTVVVGEGLSFKIGPAMAGVLTNTKDRTVDLQAFMSAWRARVRVPNSVRVTVDIDPCSFL